MYFLLRKNGIFPRNDQVPEVPLSIESREAFLGSFLASPHIWLGNFEYVRELL